MKGWEHFLAWLGDRFLHRTGPLQTGSELFCARRALADPWPASPGVPRLWLHAASLGESRLLLLLHAWTLEAQKDHPIEFLITTSTVAGADFLRKHGLHARYFPYDLPSIMSRFLDAYSPTALCLIETELWPTLLSLLAKKGIPVFIANGRMRPSTFYLWRWLLFLGWDLRAIRSVAVQSLVDRERFQALHVPVTAALGSLKVALPVPASKTHSRPWKKWTWFCASVQEKEQAMLIAAWQAVHDQSMIWVIAPRQLSTLPTWEEALSNHHVCRWSQWQGEEVDVLLVDQFGVLDQFYAWADVVFMGGSLMAHGGQNFLEAMQHQVCVMSGPHLFNFQDLADHFVAHQSLTIVRTVAELESALRLFRADPQQAKALGIRAYQVLSQLRLGVERRYRDWWNEMLCKERIC